MWAIPGPEGEGRKTRPVAATPASPPRSPRVSRGGDAGVAATGCCADGAQQGLSSATSPTEHRRGGKQHAQPRRLWRWRADRGYERPRRRRVRRHRVIDVPGQEREVRQVHVAVVVAVALRPPLAGAVEVGPYERHERRTAQTADS